MASSVDQNWLGDGSVKQVKEGRHKGKWRFQWTIVDAGVSQKVDKLFKTKGEAATWRDEKKVALKSGARSAAVKAKAKSFVTLGQMWTEMAGTREQEFRNGKWVSAYGDAPQTVKTKKYRWDKWVKGSPIESRTLRGLVRDDAYAHVERMRRAGASIATMNDVLGVLKLLVNNAIDEKPECQTMANPFLRIVLQTNEEKARAVLEKQMRESVNPTRVALAPDQAREGMEQIGDLAALAVIAVHTLAGLRLGEGMALSVPQLDFARGVIVVDRAVHIGANGEQYVGLPKRNKIRLAAMCPTLAAILRDYIASLPAGQEFLFAAESMDKPMMKYRYYDLWREGRMAAGFPEGYGTQEARMTCNNWIEKLMPSVSLSTRLEHMGHSVGRGSGNGVAVNINNYTAHIPSAYALLSSEIESTVFSQIDRPTKIREIFLQMAS